MQKKNLFKKRLNKLVISITERIESFFNFFKENIFHKKKFSESIKTIDKKIFIGAASILIIVISYFLIPIFYDENKIKNQIENQILEQYNLEVKFNKSFRYGLFPKPHFSFKNTKITHNSNDIAESNDSLVFISVGDFFSPNKIIIKNLVFDKTTFKIKSSNLKFFIDLLEDKKSNQKIDFLDSKFFYLDKKDEIIFLINLKRLNYLYQETLIKKLSAKFDIYNLPVSLEVEHNIFEKKFSTKIKSLPLRLNIHNVSKYSNQNLDSELNLTVINKDKKIYYKFENNSLNFSTPDNKINGNINIKPFFIYSNVNLFQINLKKIFKENSILINILKSEVLNNNNLNAKINISADNLKDINFLNQISFSLYFEEGGIFLKNLITTFKDAVIINLNDTQFIIDDNKIKFAGYVNLNFIDTNNFYSHFQVNKNNRKNIKKIEFGFLFDLDDEFIEIDNLKVNGNVNQNLEKFLNNFNSKKYNIFNKIILKNSVKNFFKNY